MSETTAAIHSNCAKCGEPIGDSALFIGSKIYHHHCSPYQGAKFEAGPPRGAEGEPAEPVAYVDITGTVSIPEGSPLGDMVRALPTPPIGKATLPLYARPSPPPYTGEVGEAPPVASELRRAANALINNLWIGAVDATKSHDENWKEFDHRFPGVKWLHDELAALAAVSVPGK